MYTEEEKWKFVDELEHYARQGVSLLLEGHKSSPYEIYEVCFIKEHNNYMRDYIWNEENHLDKIDFQKVNDNR